MVPIETKGGKKREREREREERERERRGFLLGFDVLCFLCKKMMMPRLQENF
jgi:hypothetical protein